MAVFCARLLFSPPARFGFAIRILLPLFENLLKSVSFYPPVLCDREVRESLGFTQQSAQRSSIQIVQLSENKLFSEKTAKNADLAAYLLRELLLCGQSAYGKWLGIVHSSENEIISENANKNRSPDA